jgi:hypothetical protein
MPISTCEHLETTEYTQHRFNTVWQLSCCDIREINWVNKIWFSKLYKLANSLFFPFLSFICLTPPFAILNISQTLAWKICPVYTVNNLFHGTLDIQIYPILKKPWDWLFQWYKWNILTMAQLCAGNSLHFDFCVVIMHCFTDVSSIQKTVLLSLYKIMLKAQPAWWVRCVENEDVILLNKQNKCHKLECSVHNPKQKF